MKHRVHETNYLPMPVTSWAAAARPGAMFLALLLLAGCAANTMKTTPIWDQEYSKGVGPAEDRINAWPFLYYRNPALSVLWPLITVTDESQAVIPVYEYDKAKGDLRVLTVNYNLPSAARFIRSEQYTRVLNVISNRKEQKFLIVPVYFQDSKRQQIFILPLLYKDKNEFWTPLYTRTRHLQGVLGPLFFVLDSHGTKEYDLPFPLVAFWSGPNRAGSHVWPLYGYKRQGDWQRLNLGMLLYQGEWSKDDREGWALLGLGGYTRKPAQQTDYLVPFWFHSETPTKSRFYSLPWIRQRDGDFEFDDALLNGYIKRRDGDKVYQAWFWPLAHAWRSNAGEGWAVLPLAMRRSEKGGPATFYSPLFCASSDGRLLNVGLFLYHARLASDRQYHAAFWPLAQWWREPRGRGLLVLPLLYDQTTSDGDRTLLTPVYQYARTGQRATRSVLWPLYYEKNDPVGDRLYRSVCWPLSRQWRDADGSGYAALTWFQSWQKDGGHEAGLLPLFFRNVEKDGQDFISLPWSRGWDNDSSYFNLGGILYHHSRDRQGVGTWLLAGAIGWDRDLADQKHSAHVFPLFWYDDSPEQWNYHSILTTVERSKLSEAGLREKLAAEARQAYEKTEWIRKNPQSYQRTATLKSNAALLTLAEFNTQLTAQFASAKRATTTVSTPPATPPSGTPPVEIKRSSAGHVFPLFAYDSVEGKGGSFNLLWRLYDSKTVLNADGSTYWRGRVLWRVWHREREGAHIATDIFPFMLYDRDRDLMKFSFLGGLFEISRKDAVTKHKLCYLPF